MNLFQIFDRFNYPMITDAAALAAKVTKEAGALLAARDAAIMTFEVRGRKIPAALEESAAMFATILAHPEEVRDWAVETALVNRNAELATKQFARTMPRPVNGHERFRPTSYREMAAT